MGDHGVIDLLHGESAGLEGVDVSSLFASCSTVRDTFLDISLIRRSVRSTLGCSIVDYCSVPIRCFNLLVSSTSDSFISSLKVV